MKLSNFYEDIYCKTFRHEELDESSITQLEELETIKSTYVQAKSMPVWPFNAGLFRKFFITILSPFAAFLIPLLVEKIINFILN